MDLISRQAAINVLEERLQANGYSNAALVSELNRSIGYLKRLPSAERREVQSSECEYWDDESNFCTLYRPSAERRGQWVNIKISISGDSSAECSLCGAVVHNNFSNVVNYCPNCGSRMDGWEE